MEQVNNNTKSVNLEQQGMLAKLLAKENLRVQHGNYRTAFFDVKARVLGLPVWEDKGKAVYDLLCGHEVGHALFTPANGHELFHQACPGVPFDVCNVVEDVRIERMIQDSYPGLSVSFRQAYSKLAADNFFGVKGKELAKLSMLDRFNIHAKTRGIIPVPLSDEEMALYKRAYMTKDFNEVLEVCKDIAALANKKQEEKQQKPVLDEKSTDNQDETPDNDDSMGSQESSDSDDSNSNATESQTQDMTEQTEQTTTSSSASNIPSSNPELQAQTLSAFEESVKNMAVVDHSKKFFCQPSDSQIDSIIIPYKTILSARKKSVAKYTQFMTNPDVVKAIADIRNRSKKYVSTLTNEFNRRKAAYQYSRSRQSSTGTLNVNRLHSYKFEDDIFKSITKLADAKNHGMIFFVDYSSSMNYAMSAVLEQTVNLVMFCRNLNIPFRVYGFTTQHDLNVSNTYYKNAANDELCLAYLKLIEIFSSDMSKSEFSEAVDQVCAQSAWYKNRTLGASSASNYIRPTILSEYETLDGTPLAETAVAAHIIVKNFRKNNPVQKMTVMFLTDGDGGRLSLIEKQEAHKHMTHRYANETIGVLNGRKLSLPDCSFDTMYPIMIENLAKTCDCTTVSFFIPCNNKAAQKKINQSLIDKKSGQVNYTKNLANYTSYKKNGLVEIAGGYGFDAYYVLGVPSDLAIDEDESFDPEFDNDVKITVNKLTTAFVKFNSNKNESRVLLNKFAAKIA